MLEKLYDYTPDEVENTISAFASNLIAEHAVLEEDEAIKAAFCLAAMDLSNHPLTEDELQEACEKIQLYLLNDGEEN